MTLSYTKSPKCATAPDNLTTSDKVRASFARSAVSEEFRSRDARALDQADFQDRAPRQQAARLGEIGPAEKMTPISNASFLAVNLDGVCELLAQRGACDSLAEVAISRDGKFRRSFAKELLSDMRLQLDVYKVAHFLKMLHEELVEFANRSTWTRRWGRVIVRGSKSLLMIVDRDGALHDRRGRFENCAHGVH